MMPAAVPHNSCSAQSPSPAAPKHLWTTRKQRDAGSWQKGGMRAAFSIIDFWKQSSPSCWMHPECPPPASCLHSGPFWFVHGLRSYDECSKDPMIRCSCCCCSCDVLWSFWGERVLGTGVYSLQSVVVSSCLLTASGLLDGVKRYGTTVT